MKEINDVLGEIGKRNGLDMALDENGACTLELADGQVMLIQERAEMDELDFVATIGQVPEEVRAEVFTELLAANFYWKETLGATISWNADLDEAVIMYPLALSGAMDVSVETIFTRFVELQSVWADRLAGLVAAAQERNGEEPGEDDEGDAGEGDSDLIIKA